MYCNIAQHFLALSTVKISMIKNAFRIKYSHNCTHTHTHTHTHIYIYIYIYIYIITSTSSGHANGMDFLVSLSSWTIALDRYYSIPCQH